MSIVDWNTSSWGPPRTLPGGTSHRHWLKHRGKAVRHPLRGPIHGVQVRGAREPGHQGQLSHGHTPSPPPGLQPLPGAPLVDLAGQNLAKWVDQVQEVASHMRLPPHVAVECPASDIVEVLNRLEDMTQVRYCRLCFGVGRQCRCSVMPHQAPGAATSLWSPPVPSYTAMASSTETIASTSTASRAVGTSSMPPLEAMETLPPLSMASLLLAAGVGRGTGGRTLPRAPTAPGPHQSRLRAPPPQMPAPGGQGATASIPYEQQVTPPSTLAPGQSAAPCASRSQSRERLAGEATRPQGRSTSRGPRCRQ